MRNFRLLIIIIIFRYDSYCILVPMNRPIRHGWWVVLCFFPLSSLSSLHPASRWKVWCRLAPIYLECVRLCNWTAKQLVSDRWRHYGALPVPSFCGPWHRRVVVSWPYQGHGWTAADCPIHLSPTSKPLSSEWNKKLIRKIFEVIYITVKIRKGLLRVVCYYWFTKRLCVFMLTFNVFFQTWFIVQLTELQVIWS